MTKRVVAGLLLLILLSACSRAVRFVVLNHSNQIIEFEHRDDTIILQPGENSKPLILSGLEDMAAKITSNGCVYSYQKLDISGFIQSNSRPDKIKQYTIVLDEEFILHAYRADLESDTLFSGDVLTGGGLPAKPNVQCQ